jgi:hypothetical protein
MSLSGFSEGTVPPEQAEMQMTESPSYRCHLARWRGGHRAGERASALAVVAIEQFTLNTFKWFFGSNHAVIVRFDPADADAGNHAMHGEKGMSIAPVGYFGGADSAGPATV